MQETVRPQDSHVLVENPEMMDMLKDRYACCHFRILVIGRANAGKTTILEKVCGVAQGTKPIIYDQHGDLLKPNVLSRLKHLFWKKESASHLKSSIERGIHDIEHQITYPGSNFIFHDSQGFESGAKEEIEEVWKFIEKKSTATDLKDQLHAIWYCIPMDSPRPLGSAELQFFNKGAGVPLVLVFTKFDGQIIQEWGKLTDMKHGKDRLERARENAEKALQEVYLPKVMNTDHPPKAFLKLEEMHKPEKDCPELTEKTAQTIDNDSLHHLFVSTQVNNLDLCVKSALQAVMRRKDSWRIIPGVVFTHFPYFWSNDDFHTKGKHNDHLTNWTESRVRRHEEHLEEVLEFFRHFFFRRFKKELSSLFKACGVEVNDQFVLQKSSHCQALVAIVIIAKQAFWAREFVWTALKNTLDQFMTQDYVVKLKTDITVGSMPSGHADLITYLYNQTKI